MKKKKTKITFLLDKSNNWIEKYVKKSFKKKFKKYSFEISFNPEKITNQDIVFILGYTKILSENFLIKNNLNLVIHASNLPKGKGFSPVQWQILENKKKIPFCLIEAAKKVDSGSIFIKKYLMLKGDELENEIRFKQAELTIKLIKLFLKKYPNIKGINQKGKSTFYKRRYKKDSRLKINKSIIHNFNLLRIVNNEKYPAYFIHKKQKYILKIFKENKFKNNVRILKGEK